MTEWIPVILTVVGSVSGAWLGVKLTVTRLETQMLMVLKEIESLRDDRHRHAGFITEHEMRITEIERWRERSER